MFHTKILNEQQLKYLKDSKVTLKECTNIYDGTFYIIETVEKNNTILDLKSTSDKQKAEKIYNNIISLDTKKYLFSQGYIK